MTEFQKQRIEYLIDQANKQTIVALNKADAEILLLLLKVKEPLVDHTGRPRE